MQKTAAGKAAALDFPCVTTHKHSVSPALMVHMRGVLSSGGSAAKVASMLEEQYSAEYHRLRLQHAYRHIAKRDPSCGSGTGGGMLYSSIRL